MASNTGLAISALIGATLGASVDRTFKSLNQRALAAKKDLKGLELRKDAVDSVVKYKTALDQLRTKQAALGRSSPRLEKGIRELEQRYKAAKAQIKGYGYEVRDAAQHQQRLAKEIGQTERRLRGMDRAQGRRQAFADARGQIVAGLGHKAQADDLARAGTRLGTVQNTTNTAQAMAESRRNAAALVRSGRVLGNESDLLNTEYALNSAGLEASVSRVGAAIVSRVATVTNGMSEQVGEIVATAYNNLGDSLDGSAEQKLGRIADLLTKTQLKFQIRDFDQLGESMKYGAPVLAQYNVDLAQGVTLLGALNSAGLQGSQAGTAFAATMRTMGKAAEEFGFELVRNEKGQFDFIATMQALEEAIGGFDNLDDATIARMQAVFGEEGIRGAVLLGKQLDKLPAALKDVAEGSKGIVDSKFGDFANDSAGKTQRLQQSLTSLGAAIGTSLAPVTDFIVDHLADMAAGAADLIENMGSLGTMVGVASTAWGAYKTAALVAALATGNVGKAIDLVTMRKLPSKIGKLGGLLKAGAMSAGGQVALAGAGGYAAGTLINDTLVDGTSGGDAIGSGIARVMAFLGSDEAKAAIKREQANNVDKALAPVTVTDNSTTTIQIQQQPGESADDLAERVVATQERHRRGRNRGALFDAQVVD